jgi:CDP-glucose 4,6-dehydratase
LEDVVVRLFDDVYRGRRVFLTGHTGFKGSWLASWLHDLGAAVTGFALPPAATPNHWDLLRLPISDVRGDIRDLAATQEAIHKCQPEIVFHLAAQPLVRRSYKNPLESWSTNVMGTANLLEACRTVGSLRAIVVITTDKVYANEEWPWPYRESDKLGGHDPYSASKCAAELVADSYRKAFFAEKGHPLLATARAGNVIGGGDWSDDRLVPDVVRAVSSGRTLEIRSPQSTRSWLHVLDCLSGYLSLGHQLLAGRSEFADAWNFGPASDDNLSVVCMLGMLKEYWPELSWRLSEIESPHEANLLFLDSSKAGARLKWKPLWNLQDALAATATWYRHYLATDKTLTGQQLGCYAEAAIKGASSWALR